MSTITHTETAAVTVPRPRRKSRRKARARGGIAWIVVSGILLAGVVFVNVAVLQLNLKLDNANAERAKLQADNAALQSQYASLVSSPQVSSAAYRKLGLEFLDPSTYTYINVARP